MKKIRTPVAERTWKEKLDVTILEQLWKIRTRRPGTRHIDEVLELFVCWCFFNLSGIISFVDWVGACVSVQGGSGVGRESTCQFLEWFWWFFRCKFPVCNFSLTVRVLKRLSPDSFYHLFSGRFQWQGTSKNCMILMLNTKENSTHIEEIENKLPRYPPRLVILMCFVAHQQEMPVVFQWFRPHHEKKKRFLRAKTNPRPNLLILASILTCSQTVDFAPSQKEHDQILRKEPIERCTRHECHLAVLLFGWKCSAQTKRLQGGTFVFPDVPSKNFGHVSRQLFERIFGHVSPSNCGNCEETRGSNTGQKISHLEKRPALHDEVLGSFQVPSTLQRCLMFLEKCCVSSLMQVAQRSTSIPLPLLR